MGPDASSLLLQNLSSSMRQSVSLVLYPDSSSVSFSSFAVSGLAFYRDREPSGRLEHSFFLCFASWVVCLPYM